MIEPHSALTSPTLLVDRVFKWFKLLLKKTTRFKKSFSILNSNPLHQTVATSINELWRQTVLPGVGWDSLESGGVQQKMSTVKTLNAA